MDFLQKITLSPLEKYVMYNRFPWKLIIHILLLIFTTYQALSIVGQRTAHSRAEHRVLKYVLLDSDDDSDLVTFYSLQDFQDQLNQMIENLQQFDDIVIQKVDMSQAEYYMNVYYRKFTWDNVENTIYEIDIDEGIVQPFNASDITSIKQFLSQIAMIEFQGFGILNYVEFPDLLTPQSCLNWTFTIQYNFESYANIIAQIDTSNSNCHSQNQEYGQNFLFIHFVVLILAGISLFLSWKHIYQTGAEYMHQKFIYKQIQGYVNQSESQNQTPVQAALAQPQDQEVIQKFGTVLDFKKTWEELSFLDKMRFFDMWFVISILGAFLQIIGSLIAILDGIVNYELSIFRFQEALIGFGCMLAWLIMLKYLEYNPNINLMTSTLKRASSNILMFLLGVLPFFFGFVFLGQCIFWKFEKFSNTTQSILTLFSLSNGDIVSDTFMDTWSSGILGQLFLLVFMILFFTAVQNVFITIIMEGYEENRKEQQQQKSMGQAIKEQLLQQSQAKMDNQMTSEFNIKEQAFDDQEEQKDDQEKFLQQQAEQHVSKTGEEQQDDKEMVIGKLKLNAKRVERMLDEMNTILEEIDTSHIKYDEKIYLLAVYKENVDNISRNIKFQISNMTA